MRPIAAILLSLIILGYFVLFWSIMSEVDMKRRGVSLKRSRELLVSIISWDISCYFWAITPIKFNCFALVVFRLKLDAS